MLVFFHFKVKFYQSQNRKWGLVVDSLEFCSEIRAQSGPRNVLVLQNYQIFLTALMFVGRLSL